MPYRKKNIIERSEQGNNKIIFIRKENLLLIFTFRSFSNMLHLCFTHAALLFTVAYFLLYKPSPLILLTSLSMHMGEIPYAVLADRYSVVCWQPRPCVRSLVSAQVSCQRTSGFLTAHVRFRVSSRQVSCQHTSGFVSAHVRFRVSARQVSCQHTSAAHTNTIETVAANLWTTSISVQCHVCN